MTTFSTGMILVTNIRLRKQLYPNQPVGGPDLEDLHRCMRVLASSEEMQVFHVSQFTIF